MDEHKMFEIDPQLFVTCRLCLKNMGTYQIVPSVQKQIKFCYEIEVDPFDALPQLICRDCESILRQYFEVKTDYLTKQENLRERLKTKNATSHSPAIQHEYEIVSSSQEICSKRKNIIRFHSSSEASDENCSVKSEDTRQKNCKSTPSSVKPDDVELGYKKCFICSFCNHQCKSKYKITRHINTHSSIKEKYVNLINRDCYVKLNRVDNKPNICKSKKHVVLRSDKITHSVHKFYYVLLRPKENSNNISDRFSSPELNHITESHSSDDVIATGCPNRRRKNRILSNDTVVIGNGDLDSSMVHDDLKHKATAIPNDSVIKDDECISIDDSDTESCKSGEVSVNGNTKLTSPVNNSECKTIRDIISLCFKRHSKKLESNDTTEANMPCHTIENQPAKIDSNLKHKVLSIGQKMINNPACSCTGILRYLQHKNLEIVWTPKIPKPSNKKPDCVRIKMKLKSHDEKDSDSGWNVLENSNKVHKKSNYISDSPIEKELSPKTDNAGDKSSEKNNTGDKQGYSTERTTVVHVGNQCKERILKKILNENPVANPKTLAKKTPRLIKKKKKIKSKDDKPVPVNMPIIERADDVLMPVITSTVSLATTADADKQNPALDGLLRVPIALIAGPSSVSRTITSTDTTNNAQEPVVANFPRIKVKSASQLMSNSPTNLIATHFIPQANMPGQSQNINMPHENNSSGVAINFRSILRPVNTTGCQNNVQLTQTSFEPNTDARMPMSYQNNTKEVVMHSVDMPHMRTTSPFSYLKSVLQIHNIYLLCPDDIRQDSIKDFVCLLKFKLVFQQESASPVSLCLALFNLNDKFFVKVNGVNDVEIDLRLLSPNWQWEILKVYSGEVVTKMLANAQKVSSEVYENTRKFVCYLNSIKCLKNV